MRAAPQVRGPARRSRCPGPARRRAAPPARASNASSAAITLSALVDRLSSTKRDRRPRCRWCAAGCRGGRSRRPRARSASSSPAAAMPSASMQARAIRGVAPVVGAGQPERVGPGGLRRVGAHPARPAGRATTLAGGQLGAVAVGDGERGARLRAGGQLVPVVGVDVPVPVEVVGVQRGHGHHRRRGGEVGRLEARRLDGEEVVVVPDLGVVGGTADVAGHEAAVAEGREQVADDGRRRATSPWCR